MKRNIWQAVIFVLFVLGTHYVAALPKNMHDQKFFINKGKYYGFSPPFRVENVVQKWKATKVTYSTNSIRPDNLEAIADEYRVEIDSENVVEISSVKGICWRLTFNGQQFKTDRAIKIGDTFEKVRKAYRDGETEYSVEGGGLAISVKKENLVFWFNTDEASMPVDIRKNGYRCFNKTKLESIVLVH